MAALLSTANGFLVTSYQLAMARQDPIMYPPGSDPKAGHVHNIVGSANFGSSGTYDELHSASCTSMDNTADKSAYWQVAIYSHLPNGTFVPLPMMEARVYYLCDHGPNVIPPPKGLRMIAGDAKARDPVGNATKGTKFATIGCQMGMLRNSTNQYQQRGFIKNLDCDDFLLASVGFPDCWNGKDLDSPDHFSHMAYSNYSNGGKCPTTHSVRIPAIVTEWGYRSKGFDPASLVLASGDTTGYGLHADFIMGWDLDIFAKAIVDPTCIHRENNFGEGNQCTTLAATHNKKAAAMCKLATQIPQESVGLTTPITQLPGCNPLSNGNGSSTSCPAAQINSISTKLVKPTFIAFGQIGSNLAIAA